MKILGLDPGSEKSAVCGLWTDGEKEVVHDHQKLENEALLHALGPMSEVYDVLVVEDTKAFTMPGGKDGRYFPEQVRVTAFWEGRFVQEWGPRWVALDRRDIKYRLLGTPKGTDKIVKDALWDRFGPGKERAVGRKANPGPLYGIRSDEWQALAAAVVWADQQ